MRRRRDWQRRLYVGETTVARRDRCRPGPWNSGEVVNLSRACRSDYVGGQPRSGSTLVGEGRAGGFQKAEEGFPADSLDDGIDQPAQ